MVVGSVLKYYHENPTNLDWKNAIDQETRHEGIPDAQEVARVPTVSGKEPVAVSGADSFASATVWRPRQVNATMAAKRVEQWQMSARFRSSSDRD